MRARLICLTLLAASAATPAHADSLTTAGPVTPAGAEVYGFELAQSPGGGRSALLFTTADKQRGRVTSVIVRLGRGRNLRPPVSLERGSTRLQIFGKPYLAVGADGTAAAAWIARGRETGYDQLRVAIAAPGRRFAAPITLARQRLRIGYYPNIEPSGLVVGRDGRVVVTWVRASFDSGQRASRSLRAAVRMPGGRFGRAQELAPQGSAPTLSLSPSGIVVGAWTLGEKDTATAATLPVGRRLFRSGIRVAGGEEARQVQAAGGVGGAGVSWQVRTPGAAQILLRFARLRRDAGFAAPVTIAAVDTGRFQQLEVNGPQLAFTSASPFAAWRVFHDISEAGDGRVDSTSAQAAIASPFGASPTTTLSPPGATAGAPEISALSDRALVVWSEQLGTEPARLRLAVSRSGSWSPTRTLSDLPGPFAIAAARRSAMVAWQANADRRVRLAIYNR